MCALSRISFAQGNTSLLKQLDNKINIPAQNNLSPLSPPTLNKEKQNLKKLVYVSSAIALASLGAASIAITRNAKTVKSFGKFTNDVSTQIENALQKLNSVSVKVEETAAQMETKASNLGQQISEVAKASTESIGMLSGKIDKVASHSAEVARPYQTRKVTIDGLEMNLGTTISEISGKIEEQMREILRTESTKRIFGLAQKNNKPPQYAIIRMPTSELVPFTKAGGLAEVPRHLAKNLAAVINNGQQQGAVILDTPLYTGQVAQNQFYSKIAKISPETGKHNGQYDYIKKLITPNGVKTERLATMNPVQELNIPIYTENGIVKERVGVYITDLTEEPLDWNDFKVRLSKESRQKIGKALKENKVFENDFIKIARNEETKEIEAYGKIRTTFYDSPKFDMTARLLNENQKFNLYRNDTLATGETERQIYFSKFFTEQLYHSDESTFVLKMMDKIDDAGNVVIDKSTNKPEKEIIKLGADAIIGNDWHTGPIAAILRQLSTLKKFYGMDPQKADHLQNIPIITLLHNVEYMGSINHSQERMFNIMFGEHAAKIVENAFMPDIAVVKDKPGLPKYLWNALMTGTDLNPQIMAANYSDILTPVSEKYGEEIASHSGFGKVGHDIFKMRARVFEFSDIDHIKSIIRRNGLDTNLVTEQKTLIGINNGCDTSNNILSAKVARKMETDLDLQQGIIKPFREKMKPSEVLQWHNENKKTYLNKIIQEVETAKSSNGTDNPIKLYMPNETDLSGVTVDTPVFAIAGRIEDQKAIDIYTRGILEFYKNFKGDNPPVFYIQGIGSNPMYMDFFLNGKRELAKTNPLAAKRMVATGMFSEPSRYDGCKMMTDYTGMTSWFEPFGLVHKENAKFNGSIPIANEVGGITANLRDEINALFVKYQHRFDPNIDAVKINGENLAKIFDKAMNIYHDKERFANMLYESINANHGWLVKNGPIDKYSQLLVDLGVLDSSVASKVK